MTSIYKITPPKKSSSAADDLLCSLLNYGGKRLSKSRDSTVQIAGCFMQGIVEFHRWQQQQEREKENKR